ncbi:hypothetical protein IMSHALPRED_005929 [Imshaugia aleurites]|uniref:Uncharacterized protein n=1 Tax=Imshaugia aleurites TaxID=172621 RepID=A0A8H3FH79_9LECA|nr:hypothetical protein IMSHALPRED_005929 [Imshaugia aleurites]
MKLLPLLVLFECSTPRSSEAPTIRKGIPPNPGCAELRTASSPASNVTTSSEQQDIDERLLHPNEHSLSRAIGEMQLRIRLYHYASPGGDQDWKGDVARLESLAATAYGKGALGWFGMAQCMIEEERASQARIVQQKDIELSRLRGQVDQLRRMCEVLRTSVRGEIRNLRREVAELKGLAP